MSLNFRQNSFPYRRQSRFRTSLGNTEPRYNTSVNAERKKYIISSTRNSEDTPQWMSMTNKYSLRSNSLQIRKNPILSNSQGPFMQTKQKWVYEPNPKSNNVSGQFETIRNKRSRTKWEMKGHTFNFQWPTQGNELRFRQTSQKQTTNKESMESKSKISSFFKVELPKYGLKQSPLYRHKQTPIKIGHSSMVDTIYVR